MGLRARTLAATAPVVAVLAPVLLAATGCGTYQQLCGGQCGPPFQLQVTFRQGTSRQAAARAMRKCQNMPLVIRTGQPYRSHDLDTTGQWTAIIYTKKMLFNGPVPLLTCLHHSPVITTASWPD